MKRAKNIGKESIIIRTAASFSGKGYIHRIVFEDIQGDMTNNSHILRRMIFTDAAEVLVKVMSKHQ